MGATVGPVVGPPTPAPTAAAAKVPDDRRPASEGTATTHAAIAQQQLEASGDTVDKLEDLDKLMRQKGIVLNQPFMTNKLGVVVEDSVLRALKKALFEFYMYSKLEPGEVGKMMQAGVNPADIGAKLVAGMGTPGATLETVARGMQTVPPNAAGGVVTGVAGGMAQITRPAAGEGLASLGPGEGIVPRGGGTVRVALELRGDLGRIIRAEASDMVYESKGRERFR